QCLISTDCRNTRLSRSTQFFGGQLGNGYIQSLAGIGADLESSSERTVQQFTTVEVGFISGTGNFSNQLVYLGLQGFTVNIRVSGVSRLHCQFTDTLQVVVHGTQRAFSGLGQSNTVTGVTHSNVQTFDLRRKAGRNRHTSRVIFGTVNTQTRRQTLQRLLVGRLRFVQVTLSVNGRNVGVNNLRHSVSPVPALRGWRVPVAFAKPHS